MRICSGFVCGCALVLLGSVHGTARADGDPVFQECCNRCRPVVAAYPATAYYVAPRCGPIRRLLGRCCCPAPVVACAPPVCPAPCPPPPCATVIVPPAPAPAVVPGPVVPVPQPAPPANERSIPPVPATPAPPLTGSSYRPPQLTPPVSPPPVRLDRIVSEPRGPVEATPATLTRSR